MLAVYQQLRFVFLWLWHFHISGFGSTSMWEDVVVCIHNKGCCFVFQLEDEKFSAQEELKDVEEELQANREIVRLLQKELDVIRVSLETRFGCHHSSTHVCMCVGKGGAYVYSHAAACSPPSMIFLSGGMAWRCVLLHQTLVWLQYPLLVLEFCSNPTL